MIQNTWQELHNNFNKVFHEIFEKAYSLNKNAVALFVMSAFPSRPGIEKFLTFDKYICKYIDQFSRTKFEDRDILAQQEACWWFLEIFESTAIQNVLLNLFYIISGECIDDICNFWQQNKKKRKGDRRQIIINKSEECKYCDKLQLKIIYSQDIRNNIAHGSYFLFGSNVNILSCRRKKNEDVLEDFFCSKNFYDRIPFSEFFGNKMNIIFAFYHNLVVTFYEYFEKYYKNYSFEFEYHKNKYKYCIALNNREPIFELKKLTGQ